MVKSRHTTRKRTAKFVSLYGVVKFNSTIPDQPSLDGNTVDMDRERTQFADNSLQYQMSLSALSGQIKGMMNVLQSGN